jgi:hypothetical protein
VAKTGAQLITTTRLRAACQNDSVLITAAFTLDALNEAQLKIIRETPRQIDLDKSDTTTYQISTDDTSFDLSTLNPAHISGIWIQNGADTRKAGLKYRPLADFRAKYEPIAQESESEPIEYTRQGNTIYFNCPVESDYDALYLRIDYTDWAKDLVNLTVAIGGAARSSNVVTVTTSAAHGFVAGETAVLADVDSGSESTAFSGSHTVVAAPSTTTFTFAQTGNDESNLAAGTASQTSELSNADKGLILFALAEIYDELALGQPKFENKALKTRVLFDKWLVEYQSYNDMCIEELYEN